jgi:crossover junction endodeoxyribonuclease RusA
MKWTTADLKAYQTRNPYLFGEPVPAPEARSGVGKTAKASALEQKRGAESLLKMVQVILPVPPSVNTMYAPTARGGRRLTDAAKAWKREATAIVQQAHSLKKPYSGKVELDIAVYPADRRAFDIDNKLKCLLDALEDGGLIVNDSQVVCLKIIKKDPYPKFPRVTMFVLPVEKLEESAL